MISISMMKKEVLSKIKPSQKELLEIENSAKNFVCLINKQFKKCKIKGNAFLGGSIAKNTLIKKEKYDIDIFVAFNLQKEKKKEEKTENLSGILEKILVGIKKKNKIKEKIERIKGSRDYFHIKLLSVEKKIPIVLEIVPVLKINKPENAKNVTDLSYFHVNYILKKIKKQNNLADEIRLVKAFCYSSDCYGAESYIKGFSGYSLEVLVSYYKTFENFVKNALRWKDKEIIDPEKKYKKNYALREMNESKIQSPIILIDPTYKERNVLAALSYETFNKFRAVCLKFLKNPCMKFFERKEINSEEETKKARKLKANLSVIEIFSTKNKEDISAAKIVKFVSYLCYLAEKNSFKIFSKNIDFHNFSGKLFLIYKNPERNIAVRGPPESMDLAVKKFKKKYGKIFVKKGFVYAKTKRKISSIKDLLKEAKKQAKDMSINKIKILK